MLGLYIHIPFCAQKCPYCDFNTYAGLDALHDRTVDAICAEMARWRELLSGRVVETVFLGGGTPTVLNPAQLTRIVQQVHDCFTLSTTCEFSSEANPGAVDRDKFALLRDLGVNRLSMGVQSFQPDELRFLGRIHDVDDVYRAYDDARAAGFENINLDFIFGLPHQPISHWRDTLSRALALESEHLSLYSLIVEPETPLHHWVQIGRVDQPDDDEVADLYELAIDALGEAGYRHYEVSNWARRSVDDASAETTAALAPTYACRHNLIYWRNQAYLGVGPGAHSHLIMMEDAGPLEQRWGNCKPVAGYVRRIMGGEPVAAFTETIEPRLSMGETMMLGLRLVTEGVPFVRFQQRYGVTLTAVFADELARLQEWGLVEMDAERVRLTRRGLMVGNQVFAYFLPNE
jgi:oxygen-independent coproporphyrinogen-3 oxidase